MPISTRRASKSVVKAKDDRRRGTVEVAASLVHETVEILPHFLKVGIHQYERLGSPLMERGGKGLYVPGAAGDLFITIQLDEPSAEPRLLFTHNDAKLQG